jgi:hypothetical protein
MAAAVLLPEEWCDPVVQARMIQCGLVAPVFASGVARVLPGFQAQAAVVPFLGDGYNARMWQRTDGNPLAELPRDRLCIVITGVIPEFSYDQTFHGVVDLEDNTVTPRPLPYGFEHNVRGVVQATLRAVSQHTRERFTIVAQKLNPLASGRANVALHLLFEHACPFDKQAYVRDRAGRTVFRVIPRPIMTRDGEMGECFEFTLPVVNGDSELFATVYDTLQAFVEKELGLHMRHVRTTKINDAVHVVGQVVPGVTKLPLDAERAARTFTARCRGGIAGYLLRPAGMSVTQLGGTSYAAYAAEPESGSNPSLTTGGSADSTGAASG